MLDPSIAKLLPPVRMQSGIDYVPSLFVVQFEHRGTRYSFNTLTKECIEGGIPSHAEAGEQVADLIRGQFLVPSDKNEVQYYTSVSSLFRAFTRKSRIGTFTVLPTLACNARCVYCYEAGREQVSMDAKVEEQVIRYILANRQSGSIELRWFGGEPMLRQDCIERICQAMRDEKVNYRGYMVSNGSRITPEIADTMVNRWRIESIQISMDGAEADYIARKRYRTYHDEYHTVIQAVDCLAKAGVWVLVRCNVDRDNVDRLSGFFADLSASVEDKERVSVHIVPLFSERVGEDDLSIRKRILDVYPMIEQSGFRIHRSIQSVSTFSANHCMADGGSVVIGPDGSLYACEQCPPQSRFGDVWNGVTDEAARAEFIRVDRTREKCRSCPFLPDCTNFASCPVEDTHCRESREMYTVEALKRMIDRKIEQHAEDSSGSGSGNGPSDC